MAKIIRTQDALLILKDAEGRIIIAEDLSIRCYIPWARYGEYIYFIDVFGDIDAGGDIDVAGNIFARGNINADGNIYAGADIGAGGDICTEGDIRVDGNIDAGGDIRVIDEIDDDIGDIYADGNIHANGYIRVNGNISANGDIDVIGDIHAKNLKCKILYWSRMAMPSVTGKIKVDQVCPREPDRAYWSERLQTELCGCYKEIIKRMRPRLPELLKLDKWTPTERWILESYLKKDSDSV